MNQSLKRTPKTVGMIILVVGVLVHVGMILSLRFGYLNPLFDDAVHRSGQGVDFFSVYQAGQNISDGVNIYSTSPVQQVVPYYNPYRYHPFVAYTFGLSFLPLRPDVAYILWVVMQEILLLVNIGLSRRLFRNEYDAHVVTGIWLLFSPYYLELYMGQFSFLMASLMFWVMVAWVWGRERPGIAAWVFSLVVKSNSALFVPVFLRERKWKIVLLGAGVAAMLAIPYFLAVPGSYSDFARNYTEPVATQTLFGNQGAAALLAISILRSTNLWSDYVQEFASRIPVMDQLLRWPMLIWTVMVAGISVVITARTPKSRSVELFLLWIMAYVLIYKHVWEHQYVMLLPVFAMMYSRMKEHVLAIPPKLFWTVFAVIALPTLFVFIDVSPVLFDPEIAWKTWQSLLFHAPKPLAVMVLYGALASALLALSASRPQSDVVKGDA